MEGKMIGYCPDFLIHPGETLKEILEQRDMTQKELAIRTGYTEKHISTIIKGKKNISSQFAKSLEYVFGIEASFWCNLQSEYEQEIIQFNETNNISKKEIDILNNLKDIVKYFINKKIIAEDDVVPAIIIKLRKILNVSDLTCIPQLSMQGAFRGSTGSTVDPYVLCAWQKICELKMTDMNIEKALDIHLLKTYIPQIKRLMFKEPNTMRTELKRILAECGIAFDIVQHFKGAPVQGFIKKTDDEKILLCVTLRQAFADIFWFTLFHEIGHIINGDVKNCLCDFVFQKDEREEKADKFASDILISKEDIELFFNQTIINTNTIKLFAEQEGVPPFIVVGRLQKEGKIDYSMYTDLKIRYKWG